MIRDLARETRFRPPTLLREHGVTSGLSVLIGGDGTPFGYSTVRGHVRGVIEKLDVHSEIEAVGRAQAFGLVDDPS